MATFPEPTCDPSWRKWSRGRVPLAASDPLTVSAAFPGFRSAPGAADVADKPGAQVLPFPARPIPNTYEAQMRTAQ